MLHNFCYVVSTFCIVFTQYQPCGSAFLFLSGQSFFLHGLQPVAHAFYGLRTVGFLLCVSFN
jgi:hypothetical protein